MWNKIEDGLPSGPCLVVQVGFEYNNEFVPHAPMVDTLYGYHHISGNIFYSGDKGKEIIVSHWMELPKLP